MTVKEFHRQRRMFAVVNGVLLSNLSRDCRSHSDWLYDIYNLTEPQLRGYVDPTGLYFYSTADCQAQPGDWPQVRRLIKLITSLFDLEAGLPIHEGTIPGEPGERWKPAKTIGCISDFVNQHEV